MQSNILTTPLRLTLGFTAQNKKILWRLNSRGLSQIPMQPACGRDCKTIIRPSEQRHQRPRQADMTSKLPFFPAPFNLKFIVTSYRLPSQSLGTEYSEPLRMQYQLS